MVNQDLAALTARLAAMRAGLQDPALRSRTRPVVEQIVRRVVTAEVSADLGGDMSFSGLPGIPLDLDVTAGGEGSTSITPPHSSTLAWRLATNGRRNGNRGRTNGFGTFDRVARRLGTELPADVLDAIRQEMVNRFG